MSWHEAQTVTLGCSHTIAEATPFLTTLVVSHTRKQTFPHMKYACRPVLRPQWAGSCQQDLMQGGHSLLKQA